MTTSAVSAVESPCVNICRMEGDYCAGCWRTLEEIADWSRATDPQRRQILEAVARRRESAGEPEGRHGG